LYLSTSDDSRLTVFCAVTIHEETDDTAGELRLKPSNKSASLSISADMPVHIEGTGVSALVQGSVLFFEAVTRMDLEAEKRLDSDHLTGTPMPAVRTYR
jgi:hypothetical protein